MAVPSPLCSEARSGGRKLLADGSVIARATWVSVSGADRQEGPTAHRRSAFWGFWSLRGVHDHHDCMHFVVVATLAETSDWTEHDRGQRAIMDPEYSYSRQSDEGVSFAETWMF